MVQRGSPVDSGNFPDYVLRINDKPAIAIEAKKLAAPLGPKEAAQVVSYCSNLGVRWGAVTDGRYLKLYDAPVLGVPPAERLVLSVDLADYKDREDFDARILPQSWRPWPRMSSGPVRGLRGESRKKLCANSFRRRRSKTLTALRDELEDAKAVKMPPGELAELTSELLG